MSNVEMARVIQRLGQKDTKIKKKSNMNKT